MSGNTHIFSSLNVGPAVDRYRYGRFASKPFGKDFDNAVADIEQSRMNRATADDIAFEAGLETVTVTTSEDR